MDQFKYRIGEKDILVYRSVYAPVKSNMYIMLTDEEAIVLDPNVNEELLQLLERNKIIKVHILLTHGHYDHISGVMWLKDFFPSMVYCQERCSVRLASSKRPLARMVALVLATEDKKDGGHRYQDFKASYKPFTIEADKTFEKEDMLEIGKFRFKVTSTPGHSEGSACYILNDLLVFTGDTLLLDSNIITTFPGGNKDDYEKITLPYLQSLDKKLIVMPGHGNPFVLRETKNI